MCGIIGYIGNREAQPLLLEGLRKLEYRGYDSAGIGIIPLGKQHISVQKTQGKILDLVAALGKNPLPPGHVGLSHTRWATHGAPNHRNAHPHFDCSHKFLIVHNGIIENYENLKAKLISRKHVFGLIRTRKSLSILLKIVFPEISWMRFAKPSSNCGARLRWG